MTKHRLLTIALSLTLCSSVACSDDTEPGGDTGHPTRPDTSGPDAGSDTDAATADVDPGADADAGPDTSQPDADAGDDGGSDAAICTGDADCDWDGLSDCDERELGTAVCDPDTDGDGLQDLLELREGTDPLVSDTDADGLEDGREVDLGLDPTLEDTYGDGIVDGDRWIVSACNEPQPEPINYFGDSRGNWQLALPPGFNQNVDLQIDGSTAANHWAAKIYADRVNEVAGFLLSGEPTTDQSSPVDVLRDYHSLIESVGRVDQGNTGGEFTTHDYRPAAIGRYLIRLTEPKTTEEVRDALIFGLAPFSRPDVSNPPLPQGADYEVFRVFVSTIIRDYGAQNRQVLTSLAVAPAEKYEGRDTVKFRMDDLTNTTNIAEAADQHFQSCTPSRAKEGGKVDFYWVLDQSGSMDPHFSRMEAVANEFYAELNNTNLDYRLGVTSMDLNFGGRLRPQVGWHTDLATFLSEVDVITRWTGNRSAEWGIRVARDGISFMKSMESTQPPVTERIRPDANLITIFMSDEEAETFQHDPVSSGTGQQLLGTLIGFLKDHTTAFSIVGNGTDCGFSDGEAYRQVALGTGGTFASLCATDVSETIEDIIFAASGLASRYTLPQTPISSTLRVYIDGRWVPRSRSNGFDYFAETNSIAFFGAYRPRVADTGRPQRIAISYEAFRDQSK